MNPYFVLQIWAAIALLYFVPWLTAYLRHVPNQGLVAILNVFLGWSVIGWVVALAMACRTRPAVLR